MAERETVAPPGDFETRLLYYLRDDPRLTNGARRVFRPGWVFMEDLARCMGCTRHEVSVHARASPEVLVQKWKCVYVARARKLSERMQAQQYPSRKNFERELIRLRMENVPGLMQPLNISAQPLLEQCIRAVVRFVLQRRDLGQDDFGFMPPELLHQVFDRLKAAKGINSRVLRLLLVPTLRVCNLEGVAYVGDGPLRRLAKECPYLVQLSLAGCETTVTDHYLERMVAQFGAVRELDISRCKHVTRGGVAAVLQLPSLDQLTCFDLPLVDSAFLEQQSIERGIRIVHEKGHRNQRQQHSRVSGAKMTTRDG